MSQLPKLRFKEFGDVWRFDTLSNLTEVLRCGIAATPEYVEEGIVFLSSQNVTSNGKLSLHKYSCITKEHYEKISKNNKLLQGDILYTRVGAGFGTATVFPYNGDYGVYVSLTHIRANTLLDNTFLAHLLNAPSGKKQANHGVFQGGGVPNLNVKVVEKFHIYYPSKPEQQKIASFLSSIDTKIDQLTRKKELLEQYKKGVMRELFSQELRFKADDGNEFSEWEEKLLKDVAIKKSSNISANKIEENFGDYIIYGASGILKKVDFFEESEDYISIVKDGAGVGRIFYCKGKSSVLGTMDIIKPKSELNTYFLYCLLENIDFVKYVTGSTIPHIYFKDYSNEKCKIPSFNEQTKIANFLSAIDTKIDLVTKQLDVAKNFKKGLLQQMFV